MTIVQIQSKAKPPSGVALFNLGFRPFFLAAVFFAVISMSAWMSIYFAWSSLGTGALTLSQWHAHEMVYGYCMAVIAGFLLTAVQNWTGIDTVRGWPLAGLVGLWLVARVAFFFGGFSYGISAFADISFMLALLYAVASPIIRARQWNQLGILVKLALLLIGNTVFYLGALEYLPQLMYPTLYGGLYLVIGLILIISGRVFPGFIQNLCENELVLKNPGWLSVASVFSFLLFFINQLFFFNPWVLLGSATALAGVTTVRLVLWHCQEIWEKPLLWSMYLSLVFIAVGFFLFALSVVSSVPALLAVHALAAGGIGLVTMSMMGRVILGHTGRNIRMLTRSMPLCFVLLLAGACFRVILPLIDMSNYATWIFLSQSCWIVSFLLFGIIHFRMLMEPRTDGKPG